MKSTTRAEPPDEIHPRKPRGDDGSAPVYRKGAGSSRLAKIAHLLAIILGSIAFAYFARSVVLPLLLAGIASMTLKPPVTWLRRFHIPASVASALVLGVFVVGVGFGAMWLGRPAVDWIKSAPEKIPQLKEKFKTVLQPVLRFSAVASSMGNLEPGPFSTNAPPSLAVKDNHVIGAMFTWTGGFLAGVSGAVVLTFFLLASGDRLMQKLAHVLPEKAHKKRAVEISREIQHSISSYLFTVTMINAGLGFLLGTMLWLLGVPNAAMWGGGAALLNFLPFFGPALGMAGVSLAGLLAFNTVGAALLPLGAYLFLHLLESYLVTPFALGQRFSLNQVVIFVALIFFAWLWGVAGALLAVPLLVSLKVVCERIPLLMPVAEFLAP